MAQDPTQEHVCHDRAIPAELQDIARQKALEENPANAPSPFEMAVVRSKLWRPGRTLKISFLDGDPAVQRKVIAKAKRWMLHANINFDFGTHPDAEIRISFAQQGSWSAIGTDALVREFFAPNEPTMNYGWLTPTTPNNELTRVVLHEFGHALGCIHEHQNPAGGIQWNKAVVYQELSGPPNNWSRATIDHNIFEAYAHDQTQFTAVDAKSIMMYPIPKRWTLNGFEAGNNQTLSAKDRLFIRSRYPR
jgi:hypothetical protein